jgi:Fungal Zn(2)-Cys(6) binuclear cluster domain
MTQRLSPPDDLTSNYPLWDQWAVSPNGDFQDNYAVSHVDDESHQWGSPVLVSPESSSAPQPVPALSLNNVHTHIGYGMHNQAYGNMGNMFALAGITSSPTGHTPSPIHQNSSIGSSFPGPFLTHHNSFASGFGSAGSYGDSFSPYTPMQAWSTVVHAPSTMHRTDSGDSSLDTGYADESFDMFDGTGEVQQAETSILTENDIFQLDEEVDAKSTAKKGGRQRKLDEDVRRGAAIMRRLGACKTCRKRKIRCDTGIPCRRCVIHFGKDLNKCPCRGDQLDAIADSMILPNAFPRGEPARFFKDAWFVDESRTLVINFDLGFGVHWMSLRCHPLASKTGGRVEPLTHRHSDYCWPPQAAASHRSTREDLVFPAKLAMDQDLEALVEKYLGDILHHESFLTFPLWRSQLNVLLGIYWLYKQLAPVSSLGQTSLQKITDNVLQELRNPLENALKLLVLVHQGGDLRVIRNNNSLNILGHAYGNAGHIQYNELRITPCIVRSELGEAFSKVAHKLMRSVLKSLEGLSQTPDPEMFPIIVATFATLCMTLESLQYHMAKVPYHAYIGNQTPNHAEDAVTRDLTDQNAEILLRFYKGTVCHSKLPKLGTKSQSELTFLLGSLFSPSAELSAAARGNKRRNSASSRERSGSFSSNTKPSATTKESAAFLDGLHNAIRDSREYLEYKAQVMIVPMHDMTAFFDRLLARLFLLDQMSS